MIADSPESHHRPSRIVHASCDSTLSMAPSDLDQVNITSTLLPSWEILLRERLIPGYSSFLRHSHDLPHKFIAGPSFWFPDPTRGLTRPLRPVCLPTPSLVPQGRGCPVIPR